LDLHQLLLSPSLQKLLEGYRSRVEAVGGLRLGMPLVVVEARGVNRVDIPSARPIEVVSEVGQPSSFRGLPLLFLAEPSPAPENMAS
jgi:hypothetical protein